MFETQVTKRLGIKYPIIAGTMMSLSSAEFVAACCEAGALGILASAMYSSEEAFQEAIQKVKSRTRKPFAVNLNLFPMMRPIDNNRYLDVLLAEGVKIVETSGHSAPEELVGRFKENQLTWIHKCVGLRYAQKVEKLGADFVTVVGYENGGATGVLDLGTLVLVRRVVEGIKLPVIGGGGVADGRGLLAILALGAQGAIMGTRLLATEECPLHARIKQALVKASELDTVLLMRSIGNTHRAWANAAAKRVLELESRKAGLDEIVQEAAGEKARKMYQEGDLDAGILACGQAVGLVHEVLPVKELLDRMMAEAESAYRGLAS
jgi:nitronate monooxygenase